ncbi:hypothetical protein LUZ60_005175 [Juncus effusus]|nr:hypothetical protein LUZ60_005175 [Juncus effusus]
MEDKKGTPPLNSPTMTPTGGGRRTPGSVTPKARVAETVGGTAAGCAAVCCCCPCAVVEFVILATVKLPAGVYKRVKRARRKKLIARRKREMGNVEGAKSLKEEVEAEAEEAEKPKPEEIAAMEREMFKRFYGAGFWRSPSQRSEGKD